MSEYRDGDVILDEAAMLAGLEKRRAYLRGLTHEARARIRGATDEEKAEHLAWCAAIFEHHRHNGVPLYHVVREVDGITTLVREDWHEHARN